MFHARNDTSYNRFTGNNFLPAPLGPLRAKAFRVPRPVPLKAASAYKQAKSIFLAPALGHNDSRLDSGYTSRRALSKRPAEKTQPLQRRGRGVAAAHARGRPRGRDAPGERTAGPARPYGAATTPAQPIIARLSRLGSGYRLRALCIRTCPADRSSLVSRPAASLALPWRQQP